MGKYNIGDIVYVSKYDYDNGEKGSNHLFVIIDSETYVTVEYFGFIVSSNLSKSNTNSKYRFNETINKNNINNLNSNSIVKCDQLYNINEKYIQFKIGHVDVEDFMKFLNSYEKYLESVKEKVYEWVSQKEISDFFNFSGVF